MHEENIALLSLWNNYAKKLTLSGINFVLNAHFNINRFEFKKILCAQKVSVLFITLLLTAHA